MPASPARKIAFEILERVETANAFAANLLQARLTDKMKRADAALATELVLGVIRQRRLLDFLLARHITKSQSKLDTAVRIALRMGIYQLRFCERIPARAAVDESVELVKQAKKSSATSLVNAVLRRAAGEGKQPAEKFLPQNISRAERLGILHSHPTWLVERWLARFGESRTRALLEANNRAASAAIANHAPERRKEIEASLSKVGAHFAPGHLLRGALRIQGGNAARSEAFRKGWISLQDEASQAIPLLLSVRPGNSVLDLCAAPGGKTAALAGAGRLVVACDIRLHRLRAMRRQMARLNLGGIHLLACDATKPLPIARKFDRILVDAPCTGTGTLAGNPEIRWRLRLEDLAELREKQSAILSSALAHLAPGGRLIYSTCSLEPEENEQVVLEAIRNFPGARIVQRETLSRELAPLLAAGLEAGAFFDEADAFRTLPSLHHTDGFFAVAMENREIAGAETEC
ncbi:MAG: 16S rRNA (cytosine(967)-C(5))-methyltransferase RsmB [Candidatus Acidiferrales bacterium]